MTSWGLEPSGDGCEADAPIADGRAGGLAEVQRMRLLAAAVAALDELGCAGATVAQITERARMSRTTFYEQFANADECVVAVLDELVERIARELRRLDLRDLQWRVRIRHCLWVILSCLEREPVLARVCVVRASQGGPQVLERREQIIARLVAAVDEGRGEGRRDAFLTLLTAEGVVGAAVRIIDTRLRAEDGEPLTGLLAELTAMIVLPYLGAAAAKRERLRPAPGRLRMLPVGEPDRTLQAGELNASLKGLQMRLTFRTARALEGVAANPGASNRVVAARAGIADQGQASKLLARLERLGLIVNGAVTASKWQHNSWTLTPLGQQIAHSLGVPAGAQRRGAESAGALTG